MTMLDLCIRQSPKPVTLAAISERQHILRSYLEQLFGKLRRHKLVNSVRGSGGGYRLAKDMAQISVADIIVAVDEPIDATRCGGKENCQDNQKCLIHDLWANLNDHIFKYLQTITLKQFVDEHTATQDGVSPLQDMREPSVFPPPRRA